MHSLLRPHLCGGGGIGGDIRVVGAQQELRTGDRQSHQPLVCASFSRKQEPMLALVA